MTVIKWIFLTLFGLMLAAYAGEAVPSAHNDAWKYNLRGPEQECAYLHQLISDAKAHGKPVDAAWITRLNELEPLHPGTVSPPRIGEPREPQPSLIRDPDSPLEQRIHEVESQLYSASNRFSDQPVPTPELKAELDSLYALRPENQPRSLDQGGEDCSHPTQIIFGLGPYVDNGTTAGHADNFTPSCNFSSAPDVFYELSSDSNFFTLFTGVYDFSLCNATFDCILEIRTGGACPGDSLVACNDDYCGVQSYLRVPLHFPNTYYVIVDGYLSSAGSYQLQVSGECELGVPYTASIECPETTDPNHAVNDCDGGCNNITYGGSYQAPTILPNDTLYGKLFTYTDPHGAIVRDMDWYTFYLNEPSSVYWDAWSESSFIIGIADGSCPPTIYNQNFGINCSFFSTEVTYNLPAGNYRVFITQQYPYPGDPPRDYGAYLTIVPTACGAAQASLLAPTSFSSTTCNAGNHCNYRPSPDQVIQVTIPNYDTWRFSLCNSSTMWDSYLYLSQTCCGTPIASNDDHCVLLSQFDACLNPGYYYVTVEGSQAGDCGNYTLTVNPVHGSCCYGDSTNPQCQDGISSCVCAGLGGTWHEGQTCATTVCGPRASCQLDAEYGQLPFLPSEPWNAEASDQAVGRRNYDNYSGLTYPVTSVRFWGLGADNSSTIPCVEEPQAVNIAFHYDSSGWPQRVNPAAQYSLLLNGTFVSNYTIEGTTYAVYQYDAVLPTPCTLTSGWLAVQGISTGGTPNCSFWWLTSPQGNGTFRYLSNNGSVFSFNAENLAFCLADQPPCASPLTPPQNVTCYTVAVGGQPHIQLSWHAFNAGNYEIWSTTNSRNDGNPDDGQDTMWHQDTTLVIGFNLGTNIWTDPNPITANYKNYVITQACHPQNDNCANAIAVTNGLTNIANHNASTDGPPATCGPLGSDVWFSYTATCTGTVNANTCSSPPLFDSVLEVYGGTCGNLGTPIACSDDDCGVHSSVTFPATSGHTYLIRVGGYNSSQNDGVLSVSCQ